MKCPNCSFDKIRGKVFPVRCLCGAAIREDGTYDVPVQRTQDELAACLTMCLECEHRKGAQRSQVVCGHICCKCGADTPWVESAELQISKSLYQRMEHGRTCPDGRWAS